MLSPLYPEDNTPQINDREKERGHVTEDSQAASCVTCAGPKDPRSLGDTCTVTSSLPSVCHLTPISKVLTS